MTKKPPHGYHGYFYAPQNAGRAPIALPKVSRGLFLEKLPAYKMYVKPSAGGRVYQGETVPSRRKISRFDQGGLGEDIVESYLTAQGNTVFHLKLTPDQKAADLLSISRDGHIELIEVKTGNAANSRTARQWQIMRGDITGEREQIEKMSDQRKKKYYIERYKEARARKQTLLKKIQNITGKKVHPVTYGLILDYGKDRIDMHKFNKYFKQMHWNDEETKKAFVGTFSYVD